jgi:integrase
MYFLTAEQVATLAAAMPASYDLMVTFAAYTGLRAGEIAALRARHIDPEQGRVMGVTAVSEVRGGQPDRAPAGAPRDCRGASGSRVIRRQARRLRLRPHRRHRPGRHG